MYRDLSNRCSALELLAIYSFYDCQWSRWMFKMPEKQTTSIKYFNHGFGDPVLNISINTKDGGKRTLHCLLLSELPIKISPVNAKWEALVLKLSKMAQADVVVLNERKSNIFHILPSIFTVTFIESLWGLSFFHILLSFLAHE